MYSSCADKHTGCELKFGLVSPPPNYSLGNEISLKKYDVLVSNSPKTLVGLLKVTTIGSLPHSALNVGKDKEGNAVYAGKAWYHAEYVLGRVS